MLDRAGLEEAGQENYCITARLGSQTAAAAAAAAAVSCTALASAWAG